MLDIHCPHCGCVYHTDKRYVGRTLQCRNSKCGKVFTIEGYAPLADRHCAEIAPQSNTTIEPAAEVSRADAPKDTGVSRPAKILIGFGVVTVLVLLMVLLWTRPLPDGTERVPAPPAATPESAPASPSCTEGHQPERRVTGDRIRPDKHVSGHAKVHVSNGTGFDAVVKLVSVASGKTHRYFYVRSGETYMITGLEPGSYWLRFATGKDWSTACREFLQDEDLWEFERPLTFKLGEEMHEGEMWRYVTNGEVTLHEVPNGNIHRKPIDRKRFSEGDEEAPPAPSRNL